MLLQSEIRQQKTHSHSGGRRTDSADSYGDEPGIGLAMREWMNTTGSQRSELFIGSKIGPGGLAFPLGFNESQNQARRMIFANPNPTPNPTPNPDTRRCR